MSDFKNSPFFEHLNSYTDQKVSGKRTAHIGIGGSGLGPKMLSKFLHKEHQYQVFDHLNFEELESFNPEQLVVISKSGTTLETLILTRYAFERFPQLKRNAIFVSDGDAGDLAAMAKKFDQPHFTIPKTLGGRYSLFSSVGGIPLNIMGFSIKELLDFNVDEATKFGVEIAEFILKSKKSNLCFWAYNQKLEYLPFWFCQLFAESVGKSGKGIFPIPCTGPRDQHSLLQYFADGTQNFAHLFVDQEIDHEILSLHKTWQEFPTLAKYHHVSCNKLNEALMMGTASSLTEKNIPVMLVKQNGSLGDLGKLCFSLMIATVHAAKHWKVNPFDQPGVERSKQLAREQLKN